MQILVLLGFFCCVIFAQENREQASLTRPVFFEKVSTFFHEGKWEELAFIGEIALQEEIADADRFIVLDQLVSTYFYLGAFDKAKAAAGQLVLLGETLQQSEQVVDSLYKLSAALRGSADSEENPDQQRVLFSESLSTIKKASAILEQTCKENKALRARVLFNRGAVYCDDPLGDLSLGIMDYQEAIRLFKELKEIDFTHRMMIRLGKAYLLTRDLTKSRAMIQELKTETLEKRTYMHLLYLESQLSSEEGDHEGALSCAYEGKEIAVSLQAKRDEERFIAILERRH